MQPTTESNPVTFETGERVRTDAGEKGSVVVVTFDGKSVFVQLDGDERSSTIPIYPVTQLTRLVDID